MDIAFMESVCKCGAKHLSLSLAILTIHSEKTFSY